MMVIVTLSIFIFIFAFCLGSFVRTRIFDNQDWSMLRWNSDVLGYRPVSFGTKLKQGDKIIMALYLDTDEFPEEGVVYDAD